MAIKMSSTESVPESLSPADDSILVLEAAKFTGGMVGVTCAVVGGLHLHFLPLAAPMLFAGNINTVPNMRHGFESLNIVGNVPCAVEFGNAANGLSHETAIPYKKYDCYKCGEIGRIDLNCPRRGDGNGRFYSSASFSKRKNTIFGYFDPDFFF